MKARGAIAANRDKPAKPFGRKGGHARPARVRLAGLLAAIGLLGGCPAKPPPEPPVKKTVIKPEHPRPVRVHAAHHLHPHRHPHPINDHHHHPHVHPHLVADDHHHAY